MLTKRMETGWMIKKNELSQGEQLCPTCTRFKLRYDHDHRQSHCCRCCQYDHKVYGCVHIYLNIIILGHNDLEHGLEQRAHIMAQLVHHRRQWLAVRTAGTSARTLDGVHLPQHATSKWCTICTGWHRRRWGRAWCAQLTKIFLQRGITSHYGLPFPLPSGRAKGRRWRYVGGRWSGRGNMLREATAGPLMGSIFERGRDEHDTGIGLRLGIRVGVEWIVQFRLIIRVVRVWWWWQWWRGYAFVFRDGHAHAGEIVLKTIHFRHGTLLWVLASTTEFWCWTWLWNTITTRHWITSHAHKNRSTTKNRVEQVEYRKMSARKRVSMRLSSGSITLSTKHATRGLYGTVWWGLIETTTNHRRVEVARATRYTRLPWSWSSSFSLSSRTLSYSKSKLVRPMVA